MTNVLNHNFNNLRLRVNHDDYWDFFLNMDNNSFVNVKKGLQTDCLVSYIDASIPECVFYDDLMGLESYTWDKASVGENIELKNIGYVGMDNGLIFFQKDRIPNDEFLKLFTGSTLEIPSDDKRLHLKRVTGCTTEWEYPISVSHDNGIEALRLNGGFYQGFFKLFGYDYAVLPIRPKSEWTFEFVLKPEQFEAESSKTLNDKYPDNKGIFFYMGTRAENKWWYLYSHNESESFPERFPTEDQLNSGYVVFDDSTIDIINSDYVGEEHYVSPGDETAISYDYAEYTRPAEWDERYASEEYVGTDVKIDPDMPLDTSTGLPLNEANQYEIKTNNKFIWMNRTETGFTTNNFDEDAEYVLVGQKPDNEENKFIDYNRTPTGKTASSPNCNTISENGDPAVRNRYTLYKDIIGNALAFRIKDDGSIGYRMMVLDCESDTKRYGIIEEYSLPGVVPMGEWHVVDVRMKMNVSIDNETCPPLGKRKMRLMFYVDGKLKFISKELPELVLRELKDLKEKQEGVPYNISIGGGTQGLCDMIMLDYYALPKYILPLEENFAGSFIGWIKSFKFYDCKIGFNGISENVDFELGSLG